MSRNRQVFAALIRSHSRKPHLLSSLSRIIRHMCILQPAEFIYVSFGLELDLFVMQLMAHRNKVLVSNDSSKLRVEETKVSKYLDFVTKFSQVLMNVLLTAGEVEELRETLRDCIALKGRGLRDERTAQLFHILLSTFSHDPIAAISICLWCGAYRTASTFIHQIDPLDLNLISYLELDQLIEYIERPLFRHLHVRMLDCDEDPAQEGSGAMLYRVLKSMLMLLPQSSTYNLLQQRLLSVARFRQQAVHLAGMSNVEIRGTSAEVFVHRILEARKMHCDFKWRAIRSESLEPVSVMDYEDIDPDVKRKWLGYENEEEELSTKEKLRHKKKSSDSGSGYSNFEDMAGDGDAEDSSLDEENKNESKEDNVKKHNWKEYWAEKNTEL